MSKSEYNITVNGETKSVVITEDKPLLYVIRDDFNLTGTKLGCGLEQCGSCAVLVDGNKVLSCNRPAGLLQLKTLLPSTNTAHDPHCSRPQPNLVPVKLKSSLITYNNGLSSVITTDLVSPFTVMLYSDLLIIKLP